MALYPSASRLRDAVDRLSASKAKPVMSDYLACLRALKLAADGTPPEQAILVGQTDEPFQRGITDVAAVAQPGNADGWEGQPFLFVFDHKNHYRKESHRSNGTADTVAGWQSKPDSPMEFSGSPRRMAHRPGIPVDGVTERVLKKTGGDPMPRGDDLAVWWHRYTDLDARFGGQPSVEQLIQTTKDDLGIDQAVWAALFTDPPGPADEAWFSDEMADPNDFVPEPPEIVVIQNAPMQGFAADVDKIIQIAGARGFTIQPWQVAAYITAVRTKPFVILAGISGTGKTKLPRLVADATTSTYNLVPVRPDWTDSADLLGFRSLTDDFKPGLLLEAAKAAECDPDHQHFVMLDEMNIARVEYYLAEVLSHIEERFRQPDGTVKSEALAPFGDDGWNEVSLPSNLCIVGSVNMDESTFGFSRKVLDRSFVLEFSDIDLEAIAAVEAHPPPPLTWGADHWRQQYLSLAEYVEPDSETVKHAIAVLSEVNRHLVPVQLQVGYRVRDEIALFCINAQDCIDSFVGTDDTEVAPLDLAIAMKVLPRIQGGSAGIRTALQGLLDWARTGGDTSATSAPEPAPADDPAALTADVVEGADDKGYAFPMCAERLALMLTRYDESGFTSFWL